MGKGGEGWGRGLGKGGVWGKGEGVGENHYTDLIFQPDGRSHSWSKLGAERNIYSCCKNRGPTEWVLLLASLKKTEGVSAATFRDAKQGPLKVTKSSSQWTIAHHRTAYFPQPCGGERGG